MAVPPVATEYHRYCPFVPPEALRLMDEGPQAAAGVVVGAEGNGVMVAVTGVRAPSQVPLFIETK